MWLSRYRSTVLDAIFEASGGVPTEWNNPNKTARGATRTYNFHDLDEEHDLTSTIFVGSVGHPFKQGVWMVLILTTQKIETSFVPFHSAFSCNGRFLGRRGGAR